MNRVELDGPGEYEIVAEEEPVDRSIEIAVPSDVSQDSAGAAEEREEPEVPDWVEPMRIVHSRFKGEAGTFAQFGDSITDSRAFWYSLKWKHANAPVEMRAALELVKTHMLDDCWDRKGAEYGNQSGQTIAWAGRNLDTWLRDLNPEAAILMFGTNDLNNVGVDDYEKTVEDVVRRCLENGTVVILSTIPPRQRKVEKAAEFAEAARRVAKKLHVPLTDFHAEILARRPDDWDGALDQFAAYQGYDVPTLIARDGVHPSNPKQYQADYSPEALNSNGFSLRNYLVLLKYAEVIRQVMQQERF
ncbi:MAG: SGNH/GDSL hydrolase family protein [Planctomycetaceae bacterium]|nr:SGNH/GDSL hydrolase family protein [Planctomycetaceae bacterium]